jgi:general secretion pathway protein L
MSDRLLLRLHADDSLAWLAQDAQGRALSGANVGAPPQETLTQARRIVVLVPAERVLLLDTPRMTAPRAQFLKAVPFALEDQLASSVEDLHFALPERIDEARVLVAVVTRDAMRGWLERLASEGIRADVIIPESLALPNAANGTLVIDGERALLRAAPNQAFACDVAGLPQWLQTLAGNDAAQLIAPDVYDFRAAVPLRLPVRIGHYHGRQRDPLAFFATHLQVVPELNLLQGEFAPAHRQAPALKLWRAAATLAAAALLLLLVYNGVDYWRMARESARLDGAMRDVLHQAFPEMDSVAGEPRALMDSALKRGGSADAGGLLHVLNQVAPIVGSTTRTLLKSVEYHNATLELGVRAPDVPALDLMRERLGNLPGLKAEVTAANTVDGGVDGRVRVAGVKP